MSFAGGNPVLALLLGLALGTASCTWQMLLPILVIMLGAPCWQGINSTKD